MRTCLKNQKGFTLIEAVLSMLVLAVGLWGAVAMFHNATISSVGSDKRVVASQLASSMLETVIADKTFVGYAGVDQNDYPSGALAAPYTDFSQTVLVTEVDPTDMTTPQAGSGYKRVDVSITWGVESYETVTVSTVLSEYS